MTRQLSFDPGKNSPAVRCTICGEPLTLDTGYLEFFDGPTNGYPVRPETLQARYACADCDTPAYHVPLRDLVASKSAWDWETHLQRKRWYGPAVWYDFAEAGGVAEMLAVRAAAATDKERATRTPVILRSPAPSTASGNPRHIRVGVRSKVMERDGFRCRRCGCGPQDERLVVDHIIPVSKGGTADESNLQTLCHPCNSGKSDRDPHEHDLAGGTQ